jgi:hypothetical protein
MDVPDAAYFPELTTVTLVQRAAAYAAVNKPFHSRGEILLGIRAASLALRLASAIRSPSRHLASIYVEGSRAALDDLLRDQHLIDTIKAW